MKEHQANLAFKSPHKNDEVVLTGVIERVTFRNPTNGYSVFKLTVQSSPIPVTVVGNCPGAIVGSNVVARGTYIEHPKFGKQFTAVAITETAPSTAASISKYLGSKLVKGIGPKSAERLVKLFGDKTLEVILQEPERIERVAGIGKAKAWMLHEKLSKDEREREIHRFLIEHDIPRNLAEKITQKYTTSTIEVIKKDPFLLARDMRGVGFATADQIAINLGFAADSPQRIKAGLYHSLEKASDDGHCYLTTKTLFEQTRVLLGLEGDIALDEYTYQLVQDGFLVQEDERVYLRHLHRAEQFVAQFVAGRCGPLPSPMLSPNHVEKSLSQAASELGLTFSVEQREAVRAASEYPLVIVTGGPGCGKTTVIRAIATLFKSADKRLVLAAPTGRAAQRMSQVCGLPSSTIHRLLKFDPQKGSFAYGPNHPLEVDAVIIDETSMIDIMLAKDLFSAIPKAATIILVGDRDQLPSVGPGRVLGDLVSMQEIKCVALSKLFRRSEESLINTVAHMINSGVVPTIPEPDGKEKRDAYFLPRSDAEEAATLVEKLISDQIPKKFGFELDDITLLTPSNRGPLDAIALNQRLQARLNPSGAFDLEQEITVGTTSYRVGDRVCQRVNNYNIDPAGVFNGDIGKVFSVDRQNRSMRVEMWDGRLIKYEDADLTQISLAYAITVHRSQGSEMPCVVLVLHDSQYTLLQRQLIYTAVTRAKKLLVVVGSKRALHIACKRTTASRRLSKLTDKIREALR